MPNAGILAMESTLAKPIELNLCVNDLRIMVGCIRAMAYWSRQDDEPYLDSDGWKLKERLESLYRGAIDEPYVPGETPGLCVGF